MEKIEDSKQDCAESCKKLHKHKHLHDEKNAHSHFHEDSDNEDGCACHSEEIEFDKTMLIKIILSVLLTAGGMVLFHFNFKLLALFLYLAAYIIVGFSVLIRFVKNILKGDFFDENSLMSIATIGAIIIGEHPEAVAVMLFYQLGEFLQSYSVKRSKKSISRLIDIRPDKANIKINDEIHEVAPEIVKKGDLIVIKPGEKVPLDGIITSGFSFVDTAPITGESVMKELSEGDTIYSGCINRSGVLTVRVTNEYNDSTVSKILSLLENAPEKKAKTEKFITKFAKIYTPIVVGLAFLIAVIPPLFFGDFNSWIYKALVFLVISCPCALLLSVPLTYFCGIGAASRKGILIKGSNYLEAAAGLNTIVFDKTGTLTEGMFKITEIKPHNISEKELLEILAHSEIYSDHPIAAAIKEAYSEKPKPALVSNVNEIAGMGIKLLYKDKIVITGNQKLMQAENIDFEPQEKSGTVIYTAQNGVYCGYVVISDIIKESSFSLIEKLKSSGITRTVMLTGDTEVSASELAQKVGISEYHASLLPENKVEHMQKIVEQDGSKAAFVGDGINDAPVLALSPIGISVGAFGSDAAIEASDIVLMHNDISSVATLIKIAKKTMLTVKINIIFVFAIKLFVLLLSSFTNLPIWMAIFADVGVCVLAVINASLALKNEKNIY